MRETAPQVRELSTAAKRPANKRNDRIKVFALGVLSGASGVISYTKVPEEYKSWINQELD